MKKLTAAMRKFPAVSKNIPAALTALAFVASVCAAARAQTPDAKGGGTVVRERRATAQSPKDTQSPKDAPAQQEQSAASKDEPKDRACVEE
jgi:hypothetical protein